MNFLSALEKIPKVIENHERELEKVKRDVETYKAIASGEWKKEGELRKLKSELSELDRKISLTINKGNDKLQGGKLNTSYQKKYNILEVDNIVPKKVKL